MAGSSGQITPSVSVTAPVELGALTMRAPSRANSPSWINAAQQSPL